MNSHYFINIFLKGNESAWMDYLETQGLQSDINFLCVNDISNTMQGSSIPCLYELPIIRACTYCHMAGLDYVVSSILLALWQSNKQFVECVRDTLDTNKSYASSMLKFISLEKHYNFNSIADLFKLCETIGVVSDEIKVGMSQSRVKNKHRKSIELAHKLNVSQLPELIVAN